MKWDIKQRISTNKTNIGRYIEFKEQLIKKSNRISFQVGYTPFWGYFDEWSSASSSHVDRTLPPNYGPLVGVVVVLRYDNQSWEKANIPTKTISLGYSLLHKIYDIFTLESDAGFYRTEQILIYFQSVASFSPGQFIEAWEIYLEYFTTLYIEKIPEI